MAEAKTTEPAPAVVTTQTAGESFWKRELNGATFLSLEHAGHMILVVIVAALLSVGVVTAISLWTGSSGLLSALGAASLIGGSAAKYVEANTAIALVAALVVLVPLMVVLDRRTRAEWLKRTGYADRVAYKVPLYLALGVTVAAKLFAIVQMLTVILTSLAVIGVNGNGVGDMYLYQFLPSAITAVIFGGTAWYLFKLAKGRDNGRAFSTLVMLLSGALAVALFVTAVITLHTPGTSMQPSGGTNFYDDYNNGSSKSLEDLFKY